MAFSVGMTMARLLFVDGRRARLLAPHIAKLTEQHGLLACVSVRESNTIDGIDHLEHIVKPFANATTIPDVKVRPDDDATIFFTSGTTALPKGLSKPPQLIERLQISDT